MKSYAAWAEACCTAFYLPLAGLEADDVGELEVVGCKQELADAAHLPSKAKPALW